MKYYIAFLIPVFIFLACEKSEFITQKDAMLEFSTDTVLFDTVFTTIGSATLYFNVYNRHTQAIRISQIHLAGDNHSPYHLNIDGQPINSISDVELMAGDSMYIFVQVKIDPLNNNNPLVVQDSVIFVTNGNTQYVQLVAFGQDVNLINGAIIPSAQNDTIWNNNKPYLIYNSMLVDTLKKLTIASGCRLYFHYNSSLLVKGTLIVNGTLDQPVVFQGDRLEDFYSNIPGQWGAAVELTNGALYFLGGIHFLAGSKDNLIDYAIIKNATKGIQADSSVNPLQPLLTISNTIIDNISITGIHGQGTTITASNCLISNCGVNAISLSVGGNYRFYHCTLANYYFYSNRNTPSLLLNNYFEVVHNQQIQTYIRPISAFFGNCIIYGGNSAVNSELGFDFKGNINEHYQYLFDHCLIKARYDQISDTNYFKSAVTAGYYDHLFKQVGYNQCDFSLDTLSVAKDKGNAGWAQIFPFDILNNNRLADGKPDIGAYERVE